MRYIFILLLCLMAAPAFAAEERFDYTSFSQIPVQHGGRIKPVDTFARFYLRTFSGRESINGLTPDEWLAQTLFDPATALEQPVFRTFRPSVAGLPEKESRLYTYAELARALQEKRDVLKTLLEKDEKDWSPDQAELIRLNESAILYAQLLRSFSFLLPLKVMVPDSLRKQWNLQEGEAFSLLDAKPYLPLLQKNIAALVKKHGEDPSRYTPAEQEIAYFAFQLQTLEHMGEDNVLFRVIPGAWNRETQEWYSPWALEESGQASPRNAPYLELWRQIAMSYVQGDTEAWNELTRAAAAQSSSFTSRPALILEAAYNLVHPIGIASLLYLLAFIAILLQRLKISGPWARAGFCALVAGGILHGAAIAARVAILTRPPVGTLYESILFVAFICVAASAVMEWRRKDGFGLLAGSLIGVLLMFAAQSFDEEDNMKVLVAVLNTNFWLATHVLCITMGYAWCLLVSASAHVWLFRTWRGQDAARFLSLTKTLAIIALLFTAVGTILGGIWADQSWGRFWGWDPKENGALLIVLWIAWVMHAQIGGHLKRVEAMIAFAFLSVVVSLAWFGVNLLNVGLHSYGFITGVAGALAAFFALEAFILSAFYIQIKKRAG